MPYLDYILKISSLSKNFGGLLAVNNCSLNIQRGSITGIIGPNGSGKSTLFNLITGSLKPSSGKVFFNNKDSALNFFFTFSNIAMESFIGPIFHI